MNEISIIGGGLSGLYFAYRMTKENTNLAPTIHIYEKMKHFGGRILSQYDKDRSLLYEAGPWRISTHHKRVLSLVDELGLTLRQVKQPIHKKGFKHKKYSSTTGIKIPNTNQVTEYQYRCMTGNSIEMVNEDMMKTGYDMLYERANTTRSYSLKKTHEDEDDFFVVEEGFAEIIKRLEEELKKKSNVFFHLETRTENIEFNGKYYILQNQKRLDSKTFQQEKHKTRNLIIAVPPHEMTGWTSLTIHPNMEMVSSYPLIHVYGLVENFTQENKKFICNSPLSQVISSCYHNNWIQLSYSGGRFARQLQNLVIESKKTFEKYIKSEFLSYFPNVFVKKIVPHFWRHAVHYWKPNLKAKENELKQKCIHPHPTKYKNLYWIGESISSVQGWMEGALQTSEDVLELYQKKQKVKKKPPKEYVIYDGRILNVEKWKEQHPGGKNLIENHLKEDITELWNSFHSKDASRYFPLLEI